MKQKFIKMPNRQLTIRERSIRNKFGGLLAVSLLILIGVSALHVRQGHRIDTLQKEIDSLSIVSDSLHDEMFNTSVENGRYELSLDHLKEVNPKAAKEFEDYMYNQTE